MKRPCAVESCEADVTKSEDAFCEAHWRELPRWARQELHAMRNGMLRGSQAAIRQYAKAAMGAATLIPSPPQNPQKST